MHLLVDSAFDWFFDWFLKKSRKIFAQLKKSPYLCIAFRKSTGA